MVGVLGAMNLGWRQCDVKITGVNFISMLSKCLWYIDPHHGKFIARGIHLPDRFSRFQGYNDFRRKKEKEPRLSSVDINHHIQELSGCLMQPWFSGCVFQKFREDVEHLVYALKKYYDYQITQ